MNRACANCEQEKGTLDRSDDTKSHGLCERHFMETLRNFGLSNEEIVEEIKEVSKKGFCQDLSKKS